MWTQRVPVLVYHHVYKDNARELANVGDARGVVALTDFQRQLDLIDDQGWQVVSTSALVDWVIDGAALPERAVVLHFDNGWLDTWSVAMPTLRERGLAGLCYVITDALAKASVGEAATVRTLTEGVVSKPFMTWDQANELLEAGWEIGAHTHTHCKVADKYTDDGDAGVIGEMETSDRIIEAETGSKPIHFAYPSGSRLPATDDLLAPRYRSLRLWHAEDPPCWTFTDRDTSRLAIDCQNIDSRVSFADFERIFEEAR